MVTWLLGSGTMAGAVYRPVLEMVPTAALPPGIPFTDQITGASVLNCMVCVTRRLLPVAWMADSFMIAASLRLKPQPAVVRLTIERHNAATLLCRLDDTFAVDIL